MLERPPFVGAFQLTVDGLELGAFCEVTGLAVTVDVEDVVEGGQNAYVRKLVKGMRWPNVTLKRGVTRSDVLFAWLKECSGDALNGGKVRRRNAAVTLADPGGEAVRTWRLEAAVPVRWTGPRLSASGRELAVEELEVAHHGFLPG